jgi:hypothetical protein
MRRPIGLSIGLLACLALAFTAGAAAAADNATITGDGVRMRGEPGTAGEVVTSFNKGARVEIAFRTGTVQTIDGDTYFWYFVNAGPNSGYVYGRFITIDAPFVASFDPVEPAGLKLPFEDWGACPFECCTYREWSVKADTPIHADRADGSPVVFTAKAGEWVTGLTGVVVTSMPGRAEVRVPTTVGGLRAAPGDVVWLLTSQGEGFYKAWFKGQFIDGINGFYNVVMTSQPVYTWWVKVQDGSGRVGWTSQHRNFGHVDACGGD